jgi:O-succinylbenzoic acid--CoA ligase
MALLKSLRAEITCPVAENARETPHQIAVESPYFSLSYSQLDHALSHHVRALVDQGISSSSRVAFVATSTLPTILLLFALFRLGATACPLSFRTPAAQIPLLAEQLATSHCLDPDQLPIWTSPIAGPSILDTECTSTFLMTSGSTGNPKAACLTLAHHLSNAQSALFPLRCSSSTRWLLTLPLFHVGGLGILFRTFSVGGTLILSDLPLLLALQQHLISHVSLVPTQLFRLLQQSIPLSSLKCLLVGGAPLSPFLAQRAFANDLPLFTTYGMTEMSSIITLATPDQLVHSLHQGNPLPRRELRLDADNQIWVRGAPLFSGYWNPSQQQIISPTVEGWFPTQDIGTFNLNGQLTLLGRKDRMFISGGENIQPEEIEAALCRIPGILSARVLPISDPEFGQRPVAHLLEEQPFHTLETVHEGLKPLLPAFKHPIKIFTYQDSMPLELTSSKDRGFTLN